MYAGASVSGVSVSIGRDVGTRRPMDDLKIAYVLELLCFNRLHGLDPLATSYLEGHVYIPARGVRIGTNLGMGLLDELLKFSLRKGLVFHVHPDRKAKTTSFARADGDGTWRYSPSRLAACPPVAPAAGRNSARKRCTGLVRG